MRTVVVTGAAGFIGRALCERLERDGGRVLRVLRGQALPEAPGAACVHLAGSSAASKAAADEEGSRREARGLVERVLSAGYARVVLASSAAVYGDASPEPRREDSPTAPATAYARLKLSLEPLFAAPPHAVARLSNVYGPGQSPQNALSDILRQLPGDGTVRLKGPSGAVRDYLFVDDAADGLARLALSDETGVFNLSTGRGTSVARLVELLAASRGLPAPRIAAPGSTAASILVLDPARAAERLGWTARTSLEDGLKALR